MFVKIQTDNFVLLTIVSSQTGQYAKIHKKLCY